MAGDGNHEACVERNEQGSPFRKFCVTFLLLLLLLSIPRGVSFYKVRDLCLSWHLNFVDQLDFIA